MTFSITIEDYFTGPGKVRRDEKYSADLTDDIRESASVLVERINRLLFEMVRDGVPLEVDPQTGSLSHSGWRPPAVNAATPNAAKKSRHMIGQAVDLYDPHGKLDAWCQLHVAALERIGLWLEHPDSTPGWCHLQSVPPGSGNRIFRP